MAMSCKYGGECNGCMICYGEMERDYTDYYIEDDGLDYGDY